MDFLPKDPAILVSSVRSNSARLLPTGRKNVYIHSTLDWQKDDIELAIGSYVDNMSPELYEAISDGRADFLREGRSLRC